MNQSLQNILSLIEQNEILTEDQKKSIYQSIKDADKVITITEFKLDRTEKVKRTTAILLEETIQELELKRKAIEESREALQKSLEELRAAQQQLIQSEKMASLGELTAGIAHEIQNPLNFVNNFSEVSAELLYEAEGRRQEAGENSPEVAELLLDIKQNLEKISHHGKRADAIVKGMLQHSRSSTGNKEATDINALVTEYVKLAFHAFRGKDSSFDAKLVTHFDPGVGQLEIAPHEIGRVLLNLLNNAFWAVSAKAKEIADNRSRLFASAELNEHTKMDTVFAPEVHISTAAKERVVEITVKDNGDGVPENMISKIFQPFFTTKPTGQGTGLGLSLAYDIIKAHGGDIRVSSVEGEGSEFVIELKG